MQLSERVDAIERNLEAFKRSDERCERLLQILGVCLLTATSIVASAQWHRRSTDNANVESFNGRLRQECLNASWFMSLDDARGKIEAWRQYYNESRPHSSLDWTTPAEFARRCRQLPATTISEEPEISTSERY